MSSHANFSLLNGAGVGVNDNSKALGFVVLIPIAFDIILGNLYNRKIATRWKKIVIGSVLSRAILMSRYSNCHVIMLIFTRFW